MIALLLLACAAEPLDASWDGGPFFTLSGPIAAGVEVSGTATRGAVAWVWSADGAFGGVVEESSFEARIWSYALEVGPPPEPTASDAPPPDALAALGDADLLLGVPLLYEPAVAGEAAALEVAAEAVVGWIAGGQAAALVVPSDGARVAAVAWENALVLYDPEGHGAPPCALDAAVAGLTAYRRDAAGCGGWTPLAAPGERTEFQGVALSAP